MQKWDSSWFIGFCVLGLMLCTTCVGAQGGTGQFDIPVVVNVLGNDEMDVDAVLATANTILAQAHIQLVPNAGRTDLAIGDGDGRLTTAEGQEASAFGLTELELPGGPGKGIKVYLAEDGPLPGRPHALVLQPVLWCQADGRRQ